MEEIESGETVGQNTETVPEGWPDCNSDQVQVMLVGTYHMANPGSDEVNVEADDVLAADRQAQLRELVDRLVAWHPDCVAVEPSHEDAEAINDLYEEYRTGEYAYDREESFPLSHPLGSGDGSGCRSEVVQVGFRLAEHLDHDRVVPIDERPDESDTDPFENREIDSTRKTPVALPDPEAIQQEMDERLATSTLVEYLAWMNSEDVLCGSHDLLFDRGVRAADDRFGSPIDLTHWYDRNIRMVHHLWRSMDASDDRVFLLVGSGHVRVLRHLLDEAPMFCPVSPLPYLS